MTAEMPPTNNNEDDYQMGFSGNIPLLRDFKTQGISHVFYKIDSKTQEYIAFEVVLKPGQIISEIGKLLANIRAIRLSKK